MKRVIITVSAIMACLWLCSSTAYALPEGAVARLGKGRSITAAFSPDGAMLAVGTYIGVYLYDSLSLEEIALLETDEQVDCIAFSHDSGLLASGGYYDDTVRLWDVNNYREVTRLIGHSSGMNSLTFSSHGSLLASGSNDRTVKLWDVVSHEEVATFTGHSDSVHSVAFSPDGSLLASGSGTGESAVKLWDVSGFQEIATLPGHSKAVYSLAFSPDGSLLASGSVDETVILWSIEDHQEMQRLMGHLDWVTSVAFSPDGNLLASGSWDSTVRLWDMKTRQLVDTLEGHSVDLFSGDVISVSFNPDGSVLAIVSRDGTVKLWDVANREPVANLEGHSSDLNCVTFGPEGNLLASGDYQHSVKLWSPMDGKEITTFEGHSSDVQSVTFSPDGSLLATAGVDDEVILWDVAGGHAVTLLIGHLSDVNYVAFSPDGNLLASCGYDNLVKLWDVADHREVATLEGHLSDVKSVAFSPDGRLLASGSGDETIKLWDVSSRQEVATLKGHSNWVTSIAFSPNGNLLASASIDRTVKLWDLDTQQIVTTLTGYSDWVYSVAFSPDGSLLASGSWDDKVVLWDVATYQELAIFRGHGQRVKSVTFSPDGSLLASASWNGTLLLWDMTPYIPEPSNGLATIYVDIANTGGIEDGSQVNPFNTIQEAIDAAADGDTIEVAAGTYHETLILKSGITLLGESAETTRIEYRGDHCVIEANQVQDGKISGFTIAYIGSTDHITVWLDDSSLIITENVVTGATRSGIQITGDSYPQITNNEVRNNAMAGIFVYGGGRSIISGNIIYGNGFQGIAVKENSDPQIMDNEIKDNSGDGIMVYAEGYGTISGNTICGNGSRGIGIDENSDPRIAKNVISSNESYGIKITENSNPQITYNTIVNNERSGVWVYLDASPDIRNNIIAKNRGHGIDTRGYSYGNDGNPAVSFNNVWGNDGGDYNGIDMPDTDISVDPLFVDFANGDYHLQSESPCCGAADDGSDLGAHPCQTPSPSLSISTPTNGQVLPAGTTTATLAVSIANHTGKWCWKLNEPLPMSGVADGNLVESGDIATITGLRDGETYTVHVALVDVNGKVLSPPVTANVTFSAAASSPTADFVVSALKTEITVNAGGFATYLIKLEGRNDLSGTVEFFDSGLPPNVEVAFDPKKAVISAENPLSTSQLTLTIPTGVAPGDHPFTILAVPDSGETKKLELILKIEAQALAATTVTLILQPTEVAFMEKLSVLGQLVSLSETPVDIGDATIQITFTAPSGTTQTYEARTDTEGSYQLTTPFSPSEMGEWRVKVQFDGNAQLGASERDRSFTVTKGQGEIAFSTGTTGALGTDTVILGHLEPRLEGKSLSLKILRPDGSASTLTGIATETSGVFRHPLKLDMAGDWEITATWPGNDQYEGVKETLVISVSEEMGKAIIVLGGGDREDNPEWTRFNRVAEYIHGIFLRRDFDDEEDIYFLSPDVIGTAGADGVTSIGTLELAITKWAAEQVNEQVPLYLYLLSHNLGDQFLLEQRGNDKIYLTPTQLDNWLDQLPEGTPVIIIIEACYSGNFIRTSEGQPTALVAPDRTIITSARGDKQAKILHNLFSFSKWFFDRISENKTMSEAFSETEHFMELFPFHRNQFPQMDADGDGKVNAPQDYAVLAHRYLPTDMISLAEPPDIIDITPSQILPEGVSSLRIHAELLGVNITHVSAAIIPPDFDATQQINEWSELDFPEFDLAEVSSDGNRYEYAATYANFTTPGDYTVIVNAENPDGSAVPVQTTITVPGVAVITKGDVNNDGKIRSNDAILTLRIAAGLMEPDEYQRQAGDMNGDGRIRSNDAILILRDAAGL